MMVRYHCSVGFVVLAIVAGSVRGQNQPPTEQAGQPQAQQPAQQAPAQQPQAQQPQAQQPPAQRPPAPQAEAAPEPTWSFGFSVQSYIVPNDREYVQPTFTADRDWLHLEARYNYEALDTGSLWVGYNFAFGEELTVELTPMFGFAFGDTHGYAPGYKADLGWWKLGFYSEGEYFFDTDVHSESFFYNWSELTIAPIEGLRFGVVTQRTRLYNSERDVQRGPMIAFTMKRIDFTGYVLDLDTDDPTYVFTLGLSF